MLKKNQINVDIEKCKRAAKDDAIEIEREIWQTYMLLFKTISEMHEVIENCIYENQNNNIGQATCILKQIKFFKNQIKEAHDLVKGSFERLEEMVPRILKDFGKCIIGAEVNGLDKLALVMYDVQKCIKGGA